MKKHTLIIVLITYFNLSFYSQMEQPEFPGGGDKLYEFVIKNIDFPYSVKQKGVEGTVWVRVSIDTLGSLSDIEIKKGFDSLCNLEAISLINKMPNWKPAKMNGKAIESKFVLPIPFNRYSRSTPKYESNYIMSQLFYADEKYDEAFKSLNNVPEEFQKNDLVLLLKSQIYLKKEKKKKACKTLGKIKENDDAKKLYMYNCK